MQGGAVAARLNSPLIGCFLDLSKHVGPSYSWNYTLTLKYIQNDNNNNIIFLKIKKEKGRGGEGERRVLIKWWEPQGKKRLKGRILLKAKRKLQNNAKLTRVQ